MRHKKFLVLLLTVAVTATMAGCGCGNSETNAGNSTTSESASELSTETKDEIVDSESIDKFEMDSKEDSEVASNDALSDENQNKTHDTGSDIDNNSNSFTGSTNNNVSSDNKNDSSAPDTEPSSGNSNNNSSAGNNSATDSNASSGSSSSGNSASGNISSETTTEKPAHTHNWVEVTETKQEWVVDEEAWEESIYEYRNICTDCGADITGNAVVHSAEYGHSYSAKRIKVDTIYHEEVGHYETVTELVGYKCSCGATE